MPFNIVGSIRLGAWSRSAADCTALRCSAFGESADKELVTTFWSVCRKGNYREAVELSEECRRIMEVNQMQALTPAVLELAGKWMANRHAGEV